jgi:hypothetical protein
MSQGVQKMETIYIIIIVNKNHYNYLINFRISFCEKLKPVCHSKLNEVFGNNFDLVWM